ncbi:hypothetical protein C1X61_28620 [Pseudomonas sp. FW215-T2]|nr:hypothetical protein C1X61_28620 [Pseudomonas sp. FW215-T2]PNA08189.1 hypothetical protein C1X62_26195 [Pseudomonas sp. FW215-R3]PNB33890.1 hypothetical protein C1X63_28250 [Pseudomonas sp. FW305-131]
MADGGGPTEQDRSKGMPSLGEAPNVRGKSPWLLGAFQVTRCKSGTIGGRDRSNGYVHPQKSMLPATPPSRASPLPQGAGLFTAFVNGTGPM